MIELRFALKHLGDRMDRVLQFRIDKNAGNPFGAFLPNWTEWQDVPEVYVPNEPPKSQP